MGIVSLFSVDLRKIHILKREPSTQVQHSSGFQVIHPLVPKETYVSQMTCDVYVSLGSNGILYFSAPIQLWLYNNGVLDEPITLIVFVRIFIFLADIKEYLFFVF